MAVRPTTLRLTEDERKWVSEEVLRRGLIARGRPNRSAWWRKAIETWVEAGEPDLVLEQDKPEDTEGCSIALEQGHVKTLEDAALRWSRSDRYLDRSVIARALLQAVRDGRLVIASEEQQEEGQNSEANGQAPL